MKYFTLYTLKLSLAAVLLTLMACAETPQEKADTEAVISYQRPGKLTALDEYIAKPDDSYSWKLLKENKRPGYTEYLIDMNSQTWRDIEDVDRPLWQHWITLVVPDKPCSDTALLLISGGSNGRKPPEKVPGEVFKLAQGTECAVAQLSMIPNQKLTFHQDGVGRTEDDLIGYTWDQYMKTGDATWLARFPMVKATVRAMDSIQALLAEINNGKQAVKDFVLVGASKRGWTTWLGGAVDSRVKAIVPIVIDVLDVAASMKHHYAAYGFWSPAVGNYVQHKIFQRMGEPRLDEIYDLVDPISYLDRLNLPKFMINGSGDEFFLPDSTQFYFDRLEGEKLLRYVPNAGHGLKNTDVLYSVGAFFKMVAQDVKRPEVKWQFQDDGSIRVTSDQPVKEAKLWVAHNKQARDFRLEMLDTYQNAYVATVLKPEVDGSYVGKPEVSSQGWTAYFVEFTFDTDVNLPLKLSSEIRISPNTLPFADKDSSQDNGVGPGKG